MNTLIVVLALVIITFLVWKFWKPYVSPPKRTIASNEARLYFFYTDWCGFSKKAMPEWEKLEQKLQSTSYFGRTHVTPIRIDAENDRATTTLYEVTGYPDIKLETQDGIYEYEGPRKVDDLVKFLKDKLGKESASL